MMFQTKFTQTNYFNTPKSPWLSLRKNGSMFWMKPLPGLANKQTAIEILAIEIVDLPNKNGDFP